MENAKPRPFGGAVAGASPLGVFLFPSRAGLQNYYASYSHSVVARDLERGCTEIYTLRAGAPEGLDETPSGEDPATAPPGRTHFAREGRPRAETVVLNTKYPAPRTLPSVYSVSAEGRFCVFCGQSPPPPRAPRVVATEYTETAFGGH